MMNHMPMPHRGQRVALTIRLPYDEYREVAVRAKGRGWSMSDYIGYCVGREVKSKAHKQRVTEGQSLHVDRVFRDEDKGEYGDGRQAAFRKRRAESNGVSAVSDE